MKCAAINNSTFKLEEAEVGVNCPPMHPNCKCMVIAYSDTSIFNFNKDVVPLDQNIKFKEWKERFIKDNKAK